MSEQEFADRQHPIQEDMAQQRRVWRFERIGRWVLLGLILLALAGLFSNGPLSSVHLQSADASLQLGYQRFSRNGAQDDLVVTSRGPPREMRYLVLGSEWLAGVSIESLYPQPAPLRSAGTDLVIPMQADEAGTATLYLSVRNNGVGLFRGHVGLLNGPTLKTPKFIYP